MVRAQINNIIPFSNVDGPGNRTTIFFQTCPFSCLYCHNPETINECIHCGICVEPCPADALEKIDGKVVWNKEKCIDCDNCIKVCPHLATPKIDTMLVEEVVKYVEKRKAFIQGITVSGGECMNHAEFILEVFKQVKAMGLSCLIDSNGSHDFSEYSELLAYSDGVMLDVKAIDNEFHQEICQFDNTMVLKNLEYLNKINKLEEVRTVLLPNQEEQNNKTVSYVSNLLQNDTRYKLLRYRHYGVRNEGIAYFGKETLSLEEAQTYEELSRLQGHRNIIIV